ncbi:MAG: DNA mismatch repair protein MutS, partial [Firmicutes bacterium]|nr:DNA mismatch repair protein MutS [Bacillota bacterium]
MDGSTPMMEQYRRIKSDHPDAILFFRLGDFYEMFFDDAEVGARELELTLTGRDAGKGLGRVPMCGVPYHSAESYIARLIEKGYRVAICEQTEDPAKAKGLVRREVLRVITPGTVFEPRLLDEQSNNFLVALTGAGGRYGLAYADVSTGLFAVTELAGPGSDVLFLDELARLRPAECLLDPRLDLAERVERLLKQQTAAPVRFYQEQAFDPTESRSRLLAHFHVASLRGFGCEELPLAVAAAGALLRYLTETQKTALGHLSGLSVYNPGEFLVMDTATRRNLELTRRLRDGSRQGTLLWVLDRTVTSMGARLLRSWVEQPLRRLGPLAARQQAVGDLVAAPLLREEARERLKGVYDLERLISRVAMGSANARDLLALRQSLAAVPDLVALVHSGQLPGVQAQCRDLMALPEIVELIGSVIAADPPMALTDGGLLRPGYNAEVDRLRDLARSGKRWIAQLEAQERERSGIKSLKVGYNKVFGYYIEVTQSNLSMVPQDYVRKQTLSGAERFITPGLKEKESEVLGAEEKLVALEYELFVAVREKVATEATAVLAVARALATLDALASLAEVAAAQNYCRPSLDEGDVLDIEEGRHPVVEQVQRDDPFVPNDLHLDGHQRRLLILTGPNMGGKSTYMRATALIALMAQVGSFVPARSACIGLVDRIFTRVGASDDLATGQSTFMVEMTEVANMGGKSTYMRATALIALMAQVGSFVPARSACIGLVDRIFTRV